MKNRGFTLVEIIGVILILGVIAIIAFPPMLKNIIKTKVQISDSSKEILFNAANLYIENNLNDFYLNKNNVYCITTDNLKESQYLNTKIYDVKGNEITKSTLIEAKVVNEKFELNVNNSCHEIIKENEPQLLNNMIPIKYNGTNWIYADSKEEWYNYDNKQWANAVVLNKVKNIGDIITEEDIELWYVWIPRFKYQLFNPTPINQEINISFEKGISTTGNVKCHDKISGVINEPSEICVNADIGNWYTHPAFTFDNVELKGIWVGKFELTGLPDKPTIKPNVQTLTNKKVGELFDIIANISNIYKINGDTHMIKNMEWGAVSYLSQSKYGKSVENIYINNNVNRITGIAGDNENQESNTNITNKYNTVNGMKASTTLNISGIYDMSGGTWEYVMGSIADASGKFFPSDANFSNTVLEKYYDLYNYNTETRNIVIGKLGDATKEIKDWYNDYNYLPKNNANWFSRGGIFNDTSGAGIFNYSRDTGWKNANYGTRAVITPF